MEFRIKQLESMQEALEMREVRNNVRKYMTHDTRHLSVRRQMSWYNTTYKRENTNGNLFGFVGRIVKEPLAYGLVSKRDGKYWLSGGVDEVYRGQGYGEKMFRHLGNFVLDKLGENAYLDVRNDNEPALELYRKLGFQAIEQTEHLTVMVLDDVRD